jgi:hypothetical protein
MVEDDHQTVKEVKLQHQCLKHGIAKQTTLRSINN